MVASRRAETSDAPPAKAGTPNSRRRSPQENQQLIGMAVPQLAIDTHQAPHLSLLVNQADSDAETLAPMLQGTNVTVKTYRKLRWGGKTGLLLEAA